MSSSPRSSSSSRYHEVNKKEVARNLSVLEKEEVEEFIYTFTII